MLPPLPPSLAACPSLASADLLVRHARSAFGSANLVAFWDSTLPEPSYVVYGRTSKARAATCGADHNQPCSCPIPAHDKKAIDSQRRAGRRVIRNLTDPHDWKAIYPPDFVTFDALDPPCLAIYTPTAAWWPHPPSGANHGAVLLAFPSVFAHKMFADHHENDGLVEVRLLASRDGVAAKYVPAANGRSPVLPLGQSGCTHLQPSIYPAGEMWCNRTSELAKGDFDSGKIWAVSGLIESSDGRTVSIYYGGNPASHGCDDNHQGPDFFFGQPLRRRRARQSRPRRLPSRRLYQHRIRLSHVGHLAAVHHDPDGCSLATSPGRWRVCGGLP